MATVPETRGVLEPIGRAREAERLVQAIEGSLEGRKRALVLIGRSGVGKTTLLRWTHERAVEAGTLTAWVRAPAAAGLPPRFPIGELLEGLIRSCDARGVGVPDPLRRVVDTLRGTTSVDTYPAALPQIAHALEATAAIAPIATFIDDWQWAPAEGTGLLMAALRVIEGPLMFVATARLRSHGEEAPSPLPEPTADLWVDHVEIPPLPVEAVAELARATVGGAVLPSLARDLHTRTTGNALFVVETLREWRESDVLTNVGGYWGIREGSERRSGSLHEMIASRLGRLDTDAVSVLAALAVLGRDAWFDEVRAVTELETGIAARHLADLARLGIVVEEAHPAPRYRIAHPLYENAILNDLGATSRASLHGRVFAVLNDRKGVTSSELAHHAVQALEPPPQLRALFEAAASEAESAGSYEEAATWYEHLVRDASDDIELRNRALEGQARATTNFDPARAVELFSQAMAANEDTASRARLLFGRAYAARVLGSFEEALADLTEALPLTPRTFDVRHGIAVIHGIRGRIDEAEAELRALAEESDGTPDHAKAIGHLGQVAYTRGELVEARDLWSRALASSEDEPYRAYLRSNLAWAELLSGDWSAAAQLLDEGISEAERAGDVWNLNTLLAIAGIMSAWRGDVGLAIDQASSSGQLATPLGNPVCRIESVVALSIALIEGERANEATEVVKELDQLIVSGIETRDLSLTLAVQAEAQLLSGDLESAHDSCLRARQSLREMPVWVLTVDRVQAQIHLWAGDPGACSELLSVWLDQPTLIPYEHARALEVLARAYGQLGLRPRCAEVGSQALALFEKLGAHRRWRRLEGELSFLIPRRRGRRPSHLPGGLTQREVQVLDLVVAGLTTREIASKLVISFGTARKHMENLMMKAGVSRRKDLVPFARDFGEAVGGTEGPGDISYGNRNK